MKNWEVHIYTDPPRPAQYFLSRMFGSCRIAHKLHMTLYVCVQIRTHVHKRQSS